MTATFGRAGNRRAARSCQAILWGAANKRQIKGQRGLEAPGNLAPAPQVDKLSATAEAYLKRIWEA